MIGEIEDPVDIGDTTPETPCDKSLPEAKTLGGMKYAVVRAYPEGMFAGYIESRKGREVVLRKSRRLYLTWGALTPSELAVYGPTEPQKCKYCVEVERTELLHAFEILYTTEIARKVITNVPDWVI